MLTELPGSLLTRLRRLPEWRLLGVLPRANPWLCGAWWTLIVLRGLMPVVFTVAIGVLVGRVQHGQSLTAPLLAAGLAFVAINALGPLHTAVSTELGERAGDWLNDRVVRACIDPPGLLHLERPDLANELAQARSLALDMGLRAPGLAQALPPTAETFAQILTALTQAAVLATYRWWGAVVVAAAWISTNLILRQSSAGAVWRSDAVVRDGRHVDYAYRLAVDAPAAKEVRLYALADWVVDRFATIKRRQVETVFREIRLRQGQLRWALLAVAAGNGIVLGSLARDAATHAISLAALVVFIQATLAMSALGFGDLSWSFRGAAQRVPRVLGLPGLMAAVSGPASGDRPADGLPAREIRFEKVRFAYEGAPRPVLEELDLVVPAGASLAIVGANGAGKTTLIKLLCRLYDPDAGAILVDGTDLRAFDLDSWRARLAIVFQDFARYELPLRDNVAPGGAAEEQVLAALETAGAGELADLDTVLSRAYEGGTDLSGGQWQRIALARALCAVRVGAGVVILDEPTAQLDVRGEAEIFDRLLERTRGLTTILISHRFSTVRHVDRICVLEGGRVVEVGSHEELMALGGRYRTMFDLQAARFAESATGGA